MAKTKEITSKIPQSARCLNCQFSPVIKTDGNNPLIAYCTYDGKKQPQVARQHCCNKWKPAIKEKQYLTF